MLFSGQVPQEVAELSLYFVVWFLFYWVQPERDMNEWDAAKQTGPVTGSPEGHFI